MQGERVGVLGSSNITSRMDGRTDGRATATAYQKPILYAGLLRSNDRNESSKIRYAKIVPSHLLKLDGYIQNDINEIGTPFTFETSPKFRQNNRLTRRFRLFCRSVGEPDFSLKLFSWHLQTARQPLQDSP